jgi:hypothetical protein
MNKPFSPCLKEHDVVDWLVWNLFFDNCVHYRPYDTWYDPGCCPMYSLIIVCLSVGLIGIGESPFVANLHEKDKLQLEHWSKKRRRLPYLLPSPFLMIHLSSSSTITILSVSWSINIIYRPAHLLARWGCWQRDMCLSPTLRNNINEFFRLNIHTLLYSTVLAWPGVYYLERRTGESNTSPACETSHLTFSTSQRMETKHNLQKHHN